MRAILVQIGGMEMGALLLGIAVAILLSILIFLALRAVVLWYWKISSIVENQEKQIKLLSDLVQILQNDNQLK